MKKTALIALLLVLTATALTACRAPSTNETTSPVETNAAMTTPSMETATPSTQATQPSVSTSEPSGGASMPGIMDGTDGSNGMGGVNGSDGAGNTSGALGRMPR
jgi:hypothetical protein